MSAPVSRPLPATDHVVWTAISNYGWSKAPEHKGDPPEEEHVKADISTASVQIEMQSGSVWDVDVHLHTGLSLSVFVHNGEWYHDGMNVAQPFVTDDNVDEIVIGLCDGGILDPKEAFDALAKDRAYFGLRVKMALTFPGLVEPA